MRKKFIDALKCFEHNSPKEQLPVEYIITATNEIVDDTKVLFLSFFSQRKIKEKADFKIFLVDSDYISFKLEKDNTYKVSKASIEYLIGYWGWSSLKASTCTLKERKIVERFLDKKCAGNTTEINLINGFQQKLLNEKLKKKHQKIEDRIDEVMNKVGNLPKDFDKWVYSGPFSYSRYIFYKKIKSKTKGFCTECKQDLEIRDNKVKHNGTGKCPNCNKKIVYKAIGKSKNVVDRTEFAILQRYEDGFIARYFTGRKEYREHYKNPDLEYWENIREIYKVNGNEVTTKKYEHTTFLNTAKIRWCNNTGKIVTPKAYFYTRNLKNVIKETEFKYSCLNEYVREVKVMYPDMFLQEYLKHPQIEYMIKLGLYRYLNDKLSHWYSPSWEEVNFKAKNIKGLLKLSKDRLLQIKRINPGEAGIKFIQEIDLLGKQLSDLEVVWVLRNIDEHQMSKFSRMLNYAKASKLIKYIEEQSRNDTKAYSFSNVLSDWYDYIKQCKDLKFDVKNSFIFYPKNLKEKHEEYTILNKSKGLEEYNSKIEKAYRNIYDSYSYEYAGLTIRPVKDVRELVAEGQLQRHCVGGANYAKAVANGKTAIMLIRKCENGDKPYFTLELRLNTLSVVQCRGFVNSDMTEDVKKFIEKWKREKLNKNQIKSKKAV